MQPREDQALGGPGSPFALLSRIWRPVSLPEELRPEFDAEENRRQQTLTAWGIGIGAALMALYTVFDWLIVPDVLWLGILLRVGVAVPLGVATILFLRSPQRTLRQQQVGAAAISWLYSLILVTVVAASSAPGAAVYMTGNNIALVFGAVVLGLPPRMAVTVCLGMICNEVFAIAHSSFMSMETMVTTLIANLSTTLPALYANTLIHNERRQKFLEVKERERENTEKDAQNATLRAQKALLERLAAIDPLTDLANRRTFDALLGDAIARKGPIASLSVMLLDVDHFKLYNDHYGHIEGDECLKRIANALRRAAGDWTVARIGGEEFAIVVPGRSAHYVQEMGDRIRESVLALNLPHARNLPAGIVTMSVGAAVVGESGPVDAKSLMRMADEALYDAKNNGRNRTVVMEDAQKQDCPETLHMAIAS